MTESNPVLLCFTHVLYVCVSYGVGMFFDSVLNFPVPDGRSGQQTVDMIQKKLETLGAEKMGNFAVDSETYQSQSRMLYIFSSVGRTIYIRWSKAVCLCVWMLIRVAQIITAAHRDL